MADLYIGCANCKTLQAKIGKLENDIKQLKKKSSTVWHWLLAIAAILLALCVARSWDADQSYRDHARHYR